MENAVKMDFNGEYPHSIDKNNRIIMPSKIKDALYGESFVIYHKPKEKCLRLYAMSDWKKMVAGIAFADDGVDKTIIQRHFSINSKSYDLDAQGRFVLPAKFVEAAGLKKDIVTIGLGPRAEIWDKETYESVSEEACDLDIVLPI